MSNLKENWDFTSEKVEAKESAVIKCLKDMTRHGWNPISIIYTDDNKAIIYFKLKRSNYDDT